MSKPSATGSPQPTNAPSPARLLLAEDDFELRELLACVLRADGHEVVEACDGHELWALLSRESQADEPAPFSLVVSDVRMPGMTAFDVMTHLQCALSETPVILITAFGDRTTHLRAMRLGASRVLDKPFDFDELLKAVHETLHQQARRAS
jgi:DNA-binding response OmpR family regulator